MTATRVCGFCNTDPGGYTCPRCSADYCGLKCYQSVEHRACSENFYKECVQAELVGDNLGPESKAKMQQILQRMNNQDQEDQEEGEEEDSDDDEDPVDLADRLAGVDLENTEEVWSLLSKEERKQFDELVKSGDLTSLVPEFSPWWKTKVQIKKIKEVEEEDADLEIVKAACPPVSLAIPRLADVCSSPSPYVKYGLLNLLYSYCYAVKFFSGDYSLARAAEFVEIVQLLAGTLEGRNYDLADTAVEAAASEVNNHQWLTVSMEHSRSVKKDVFDLVKGPTGEDNFYILAALSDLKTMFEGTLKTLKNKQKEQNKSKERKEEELVDSEAAPGLPIWLRTLQKQPELDLPKVKKHLKKVEFYLSWSQDCYEVFKEL